MLPPWSLVFATPRRRLGCFILFFLFVRFWADPPLLTFAFVAGLFAFIERGAQFQLFALYRKRRAASPSLCFNHAQGGFRGHSPDGGLVRCTWIFSNYLQGRGDGLRKGRPGLPWRRIWMCDCIALRWVAPCCTFFTGELGQTHQRRRAQNKPESSQPASAERKTSGSRRTENGEPLFGAQ